MVVPSSFGDRFSSQEQRPSTPNDDLSLNPPFAFHPDALGAANLFPQRSGDLLRELALILNGKADTGIFERLLRDSSSAGPLYVDHVVNLGIDFALQQKCPVPQLFSSMLMKLAQAGEEMGTRLSANRLRGISSILLERSAAIAHGAGACFELAESNFVAGREQNVLKQYSLGIEALRGDGAPLRIEALKPLTRMIHICIHNGDFRSALLQETFTALTTLIDNLDESLMASRDMLDAKLEITRLLETSGQAQRAAMLCKRMIAELEAKEISDVQPLARVLHRSARIEEELGNVETAFQHYQRVVDLLNYDDTKDSQLLLETLYDLRNTAESLGRNSTVQRSEKLLEELERRAKERELDRNSDDEPRPPYEQT